MNERDILMPLGAGERPRMEGILCTDVVPSRAGENQRWLVAHAKLPLESMSSKDSSGQSTFLPTRPPSRRVTTPRSSGLQKL
jgi:hypothetical protein